ncbi:MAG TPA: hypothetical protein VFE36_15390 [Candidatus Baltobacteraceae bacterium]|jgi:hypothetical protein|nr:hypothetical protein [Candidatus Baltobacteraceae bacterium]
MQVGRALFDLARETGARSIFVVGTGKNVGKTVAMRAIYEAATDAGVTVGLTSIGRDGEAVDAGDAQPKPRLFLRPGTAIATARGVLPSTPASEILRISDLPTAAGRLLFARVRGHAFYELVGPPTASGVREIVDGLLEFAGLTIVDGAIDRVAALAGGDDAIVVSCGASAAGTVAEAAGYVGALVQRLRVPAFDPSQPFVRVDGALTPAKSAALIAARESRQVVVRDPTQISLTGKAATHALSALTVRCERPLRVIAATVASIGRDRAFEPRAFAHAVADATNLPTFDVYAGARAA